MIAFKVPHPTEAHDYTGHGPVTFGGVNAFLGDSGDEDRADHGYGGILDQLCAVVTASKTAPKDAIARMLIDPLDTCETCSAREYWRCPGCGWGAISYADERSYPRPVSP